MPERDHFPREYFDSNPYEGESPEDAYRRLRWGNEPQEIFEIEAPEPLATLGDVAMIQVEEGPIHFSEYQAPFLAVGTDSNKVYFVPKSADGAPVDVPVGGYERVGKVTRLDYYSDKGQEEAYYFHEHERPYPTLWVHPESGVCYLEPAECKDGSRSYAVGDEGIIG